MPTRILLKLSGELFKSTDNPLDMTRVLDIAREIVKVNKDYELGIVFGGGNIFRGRSVQKLGLDMSLAHYAGMTATIVNALALQNAFKTLKQSSRIISAINMPDLTGYSSPLEIENYLNKGEIIIFAGGTGKPFVSTDTAAVVRGLEIKASMILKATGVNGVYDSDPKKSPVARQFKKISYIEYLNIPDAIVFDKTACLLAAEHNLPIYIFKWGSNILKKAVKLKANGTLIQ